MACIRTKQRLLDFDGSVYPKCLWIMVYYFLLLWSSGSAVYYVKLVGGRDRYEGQLQVQLYNYGDWLTVCPDLWTSQNSLVVCRSLFGKNFRGLTISSAGNSSLSALRDSVYCGGAETHLSQCFRDYTSSAPCLSQARVSLRCLDGAVRLVKGKGSNEGRVETRLSDDTWVPVCGNIFDTKAASVVCRELGYSSTGATFTVSSDSSKQADSRWYRCRGDEDFLAQCQNEQKPCNNSNSVRVVCSLPDCGTVRGPSFSPRIVGGFAAAESQFPWMVMLTVDNTFFCGGTIIDPQHVVTAAHCFEDMNRTTAHRLINGIYSSSIEYINTTSLYVTAGKHLYDTSYTYIGEQKVKVAAALYHAQYKLGYGDFSNDIALLRLERPLNFNVRVSPLCLPKASSTLPPKCTLAGWGNINALGFEPTTLMTVTMKAYSRSDCVELESLMDIVDKYTYRVDLQGDLAQKTMCLANVLEGGQETCFGDSGGPVFCLDSSGLRYELTGIVSWGYGSCPALPAFPSIQTYVPPYLSWVSDAIGQLAGPCSEVPCPSFSTCQEEGDNYTCLCPSDFHGKNCEYFAKTLRDSRDTITFRLSDYHNAKDFNWTIEAALGNYVELTFELMDLPSDKDCKDDFVEVRQNDVGGRVLVRACGTTLPAILTDTTSLHVYAHFSATSWSRFTASYVISAQPLDSVRLVNGETSSQGTLQHYRDDGWHSVCGDNFDNNSLTVVCKQLGFHSTNATFAAGSDMAVYGDSRRFQCTGTEDRLALCPKYWTACTLHSLQVNCYGCRRVTTSSQGTITSANYPMSNVSDAGCEWIIVVPVSLTVQLYFLDIDTDDCSHDYIEVRAVSGQGELLATLCGNALPGPIVSNATLFLRYVRGSAPGTYRGFKANYRISGCRNSTFGDNCSQNCSCNGTNTRYCDEVHGSCQCQEGWEGATCADDVNECADRCTRKEEVCTNTVGSFECSCADGAAKNDVGTCVENTRFPLQITIKVDVDLDEMNTTESATLRTQLQSQLQLMLEKKSFGILGIEIKRIRRGSIIVDADVLLEKSVAVQAASSLIRNLQYLLDTQVLVSQSYGTWQFEIAGQRLTSNTRECDLIAALHLCNANEQCDDSSDPVVCRPEDNHYSKLETKKIILAAVGSGIALAICAILAVVCYRSHRAKRQALERDSPSTINHEALSRAPDSTSGPQPQNASDDLVMPRDPQPLNINGYVDVQPSAATEHSRHHFPPRPFGPAWRGYSRFDPPSPTLPRSACPGYPPSDQLSSSMPSSPSKLPEGAASQTPPY